MLSENTKQTVVAVNVAAELYHAQQITRSLSISSKNLRILAQRIGPRAAGLAVLASFYDECSRESIALARRVSGVTILAANEAVREWRMSLFENELEKACVRLAPPQIPELITRFILEKKRREESNLARINECNKELNELLVSMQKNIRSIAVIAVNSKIEAPRTGEHAEVLLSMTQDVESMIERILMHIDRALRYLHSQNSQLLT